MSRSAADRRPIPAADDREEITLDTEWASSLAPGATVRVYGTADSDGYGDMAIQQIIADLKTYPGCTRFRSATVRMKINMPRASC